MDLLEAIFGYVSLALAVLGLVFIFSLLALAPGGIVASWQLPN